MSAQNPATLPPRCASTRADLPGLDGHELSTRRATELRAHLADCPGCAELAASYRSVRRTLADLHHLDAAPPDGLLDSILARTATPNAVEKAAVYGRGAVSGARPKVIAAGAGVGALATVGAGFLAWRALRGRRATA
ncbi:MAG TPA: zf-HC2 domain-containing protein [Mycobacteriales bacterium]|jgi:anti-sigma factor RsiW|nr:zf-HC2 domain-containing protein [Mycobacteriales bacterium]